MIPFMSIYRNSCSHDLCTGFKKFTKSCVISVLFGYSYGTTLASFLVESALDCLTRPSGRQHSGPKVNYE
jgi:hypothetical protein